ncbi:AaceriAER272Cp [[Ashbya] aceris (nom. inval.)]|nr:AaceriAER272Cp [[Ashbya] aceris (nom. inval.)]
MTLLSGPRVQDRSSSAHESRHARSTDSWPSKIMLSSIETTAILFLKYLEGQQVLRSATEATWTEKSSKTVVINAKVAEHAAAVFKGVTDTLELIFVDLSGGKKVMISICGADSPIAQAVLRYQEDLGLPAELPASSTEAASLYGTQVRSVFDAKFPADAPGAARPEQKAQPPDFDAPAAGASPPGRAQAPTRRLPADMPGFEDEYEVLSAPVGTAHPLPGTPAGYGDSDLYPGGQKRPNPLDPFPTPTPQGGMIFDPRLQRPAAPLPYGGQFDPTDPADPRRPPGFLPGARWNASFGGPGGLGNPPFR